MLFITGYSRIKDAKVVVNDSVLTVDAVSVPLHEHLYMQLGLDYPKFFKMDAQSKFGLLASELLMRQSQDSIEPERTGIVLSNRSASLDADVHYEQSMHVAPSPALFVYTLSNIVAGEICIRHKIKGENAFFVTPEFDAVLMHEYVDLLLRLSGAKACLAGWVEALGDQHDVLLYLVENEKRGLALEHSSAQIDRLYLS